MKGFTMQSWQDFITLPEGVIREWINGYLFTIDICALAVLGWYLYKDGRNSKTAFRLAGAMFTYILGETMNRFAVWMWWMNEQPSTAWMTPIDATSNPGMLLANVVITVGLLAVIRVLTQAYWVPSVWATSMVGALLVPTVITGWRAWNFL